jgi:hypothetical protein
VSPRPDDATPSPAAHLWLAPALVAALRALPFATTQWAPAAAAGFTLPPIGYNPKDWLAYVAFIREGGWLLANPFTTEPQQERYVSLFLSLLGSVWRWTGADPFWVLELSRIPLLFLFFAVLWRLVCAVLPDPRHRVTAVWLVALSGGVEIVLEALAPGWPEPVADTVAQDLWHLQGWSTFAASYNPLWVAALTLTLYTLRPALQPGGPAGLRDLGRLAVGLAVLHGTHPYSALVVVAVLAVRPALAWVLEAPAGRAGSGRAALAVLPALGGLAFLTAWQQRDPVFRATAAHALGPQALPVFWYPVTLGVVGFFALRGWRRWIGEAHPWRWGLGAWTLAVVLLHTSPVLNGYHFVFHLHVPLCLAAAPALADATRRLRTRGAAGVLLAAALYGAAFQSAVAVTARSLRDVRDHRVWTAALDLIERLGHHPAGHVLTVAPLGNFIPAYTAHRVYVGHWFLTPQYAARAQEVVEATAAGASAERLLDLVAAQRIDYVVVATAAAGRVRDALGTRVREETTVGVLTLFVLAAGP